MSTFHTRCWSGARNVSLDHYTCTPDPTHTDIIIMYQRVPASGVRGGRQRGREEEEESKGGRKIVTDEWVRERSTRQRENQGERGGVTRGRAHHVNDTSVIGDLFPLPL